jgi:DNA-binding IclR family transcriptional regulator
MERRGLPYHTENTITDRDDFIKELMRVKEAGYALDLEENEYGITCIAVPIFDHLGESIAAVSISGPTMRMTGERLEQLRTKMLEIGGKISARLGYVEKGN